ncbi:efflux RND transporter periplasmic adaptor subunit [Xanthomonas oryzae pv. oryzae]|uniref:efflux RND transporter periplasmic adaptor subunit n=1 Tax=Xanthomonas oryzae TaxID=347 RepID=UPI0005CED9A6|nr:efflux RND transporter periplasmic adaptor subunit [Xanthomonas oryzae]AJQ81342.1 acriflavin resistance protein [Xanthomonas oryzae pv. oryzae PXO86]AOS00791.1 acriflavin resistance protein [Xanthomonas oryzae pv. oryzae]AOS04922.1 efflux transporter periplasmic adaptor subunit [Xanthomonas oryzae pv. oryzae]AOS09077.1 acriflavin resistance protein [Xanthomonas oryzae pv. oryzae]AOS17405.1 acriflavin resistance protein [Xanthomonas oryzae pv. oryzae]
MNNSVDLLKELRIDRKAPSRESPSGRGWGIAIATLVVVIVLLLGLAAWWWWLGRARPLQVRTVPVVAISAGSTSSSVLDASGYVVARRIATVSAQVTGKVLQVMIEEGMRVEAGQVMATLDPIETNAQREVGAAQLAAARSQVQNVQAQLVVAEADAMRLQSLVGEQLVSRSQYDQAMSQRDALRAQLQVAQRNVAVATHELSLSDIHVDFTVVRAPFAGVVTAKAAQPGEIVSPLATGGFTRTGIGTIVDMDSLEVEVEVGEAYIGRVQPKMPAEVILDAYPDWRIPAKVIAIIPAADRGKATVKVRVALKVKDARIVPDMGVRVSFLEKATAQQQNTPKGVRVPVASLLHRDGTSRVFVLGNDNHVALREVKTGIDMGSDKQVVSGVSAGDTVVVEPPQALKDGDAVTLSSDAQE